MELGKKVFTQKLFELVKASSYGSYLESMEYIIDNYGNERVEVVFAGGRKSSCSVNFDSTFALMRDVLSNIEWKL